MRIALLGIDGSGKSTISKVIAEYFTNKGYKVSIIPFHHWVFADKLRNIFGKIIDHGRKDRTVAYTPPKKSFAAFIKPPVAFIDNILFYRLNSPKNKNDISIFDRFICATQIKFFALNYSNSWFKKFWFTIKPEYAIILDIELEEAVKRQEERNDPFTYPIEVLRKERDLYIEYATKHNYPIVISLDLQQTKEKIIQILDQIEN